MIYIYDIYDMIYVWNNHLPLQLCAVCIRVTPVSQDGAEGEQAHLSGSSAGLHQPKMVISETKMVKKWGFWQEKWWSNLETIGNSMKFLYILPRSTVFPNVITCY